jgi:hypothetical protein
VPDFSGGSGDLGPGQDPLDDFTDPDDLSGMDEDCADGLHEYCLTMTCDCVCHLPEASRGV